MEGLTVSRDVVLQCRHPRTKQQGNRRKETRCRRRRERRTLGEGREIGWDAIGYSAGEVEHGELLPRLPVQLQLASCGAATRRARMRRDQGKQQVAQGRRHTYRRALLIAVTKNKLVCRLRPDDQRRRDVRDVREASREAKSPAGLRSQFSPWMEDLTAQDFRRRGPIPARVSGQVSS